MVAPMRLALLALVLVLARPLSATEPADIDALVAATRADTLALNLGRWMTQPRWEELLDQALWAVAPRGVWGPSHPAWPAARAAMPCGTQPMAASPGVSSRCPACRRQGNA